ncbi:hypothetical protein, conserved [Trypanosoma cruzi]|uniref:Uncharacterized protein n=2 Tax=Trypanosoma cruzi TaxID=5693 RepID=Q4D8M4_TRYCC|nr:hypothetical protein, conserved [Trypanosoma cruzi]EAN88884.1 hypothetical protein, conserved [Trypanosoma cruzi]|eukprot:XP_810735.1 hypothetical protein [Trypanosoma cruzi strain CL Brener]
MYTYFYMLSLFAILLFVFLFLLLLQPLRARKMGLLLEDEDYTPPLKANRVESHTPPPPPTTTTKVARKGGKRDVSLSEHEKKHVSGSYTKNSGDLSAKIGIRLRGGNGIEKMDAFAFGLGRSPVTFADASPLRVRGGSSTTVSQGSLNFSDTQRDPPPTVAKCVMASSQDVLNTAEITPNASSNSTTTQMTSSTPFDTSDGTTGSAASGNPVSRSLFSDGAAINPDITLSAVQTGVEGNEAAPKPKVQMKLSDFFNRMACTKKSD